MIREQSYRINTIDNRTYRQRLLASTVIIPGGVLWAWMVNER
jgi:hypothetical protein